MFGVSLPVSGTHESRVDGYWEDVWVGHFSVILDRFTRIDITRVFLRDYD
jgi:hypothetical protein